MEFRILGPLEVRGELGAVALGGIKPRAVLAVLLLHANEPVSAERLALALWGEDAPAGAVKTVQVYVSRLRKALGDADGDRDDAGGLSAARARPASSTSSGSSARGGRAPRAGRRPARAGRGAAARGARAVARAAAGRARVRAVRAGRDRAPGGAAAGGDRGAGRGRARARAARGAWSASCGSCVAEHPTRERLAGAADARALPLRPPGRGAGGLPRARAAAGRGGRRRARAGAAAPARRRCSRQDASLELRAPRELPRELDADRRRRWSGATPSWSGCASTGRRARTAPARRRRSAGEHGIGQDAGWPPSWPREVHRARRRRALRVRPRLRRPRRAGRVRAARGPTLLVVDAADRAPTSCRRARRAGGGRRAVPVLVVAAAGTRTRSRGVGAGRRARAEPLGRRGGARVRRADDDVPADWLLRPAAAFRAACTSSAASGRSARRRAASARRAERTAAGRARAARRWRPS